MRIYTFHKEFTNDLESFVKYPIQIPCLNEWNPERIASPERHLSLGKGVDLTIDAQIYTLEKDNVAFDTIASLLRIYLDRSILRNLHGIDPVKEQIWLFAYKWFSAYYALLTEPDILKSEFYKSHHDEFLSLMGKMLHLRPSARISFSSALQLWDPSNPLLLRKEDEEEKDKEKEHATPSVPAESLPLPLPLPSRRLVLNAPLRVSEHNKTRKNPRS